MLSLANLALSSLGKETNTLFFIRTFFIRTLRLRFDKKNENVWDEIRTSLASAKFYNVLSYKKIVYAKAEILAVFIPQTYNASRRIMRLQIVYSQGRSQE